VNGDGRPDLLVRDVDAWRYHANEGTGFAADPVVLSAADGCPFGVESAGPYLFDLDGDGDDDKVVTQDDDGRVFGFGSAPHWRAFLQTGAGFVEATWPVPEGGSDTRGFHARYSDGTAGGAALWDLRDLDGDGRRDLVVTGTPGEGGALQVPGWPSNPHWIVYPNSGAGFGAAREFPLPVLDDGRMFRFPDRNEPGDLDWDAAWTLRDLDGDRLPDLVFTSPGREALAPYWGVYRNTGTRFAEAAVAWTLPDGEPEFVAASGPDDWSVYNDPNFVFRGNWDLIDLDGDRRPDLVVWGYDASGGDPVWHVSFNR
jgi:hypothetical protein